MPGLSRISAERSALHARGMELGRELSTRAALFHQAIATRLGLGAADHKFIGILASAGPITAGQLADLTGLTTGAVTGVIDRLEKGGLVRREKDPADRRRVIIRPLPEARARIAPHVAPLARATIALYSRYRTRDLRLIFEYVAQITRVLHEETARLREATARSRRAEQRARPASGRRRRAPARAPVSRRPGR